MTSPEQAIAAETAFAPDAIVGRGPGAGPAAARTYTLEPAELAHVAERAERAGWRFGSLVADAPGPGAPIRVDAAFLAPGQPLPLVLRTEARGELPSLARTFPGASWSEREVRDLYGVRFAGMPDDRPLVHHSDWPAGLHPLRPGEKLELPVERIPGQFPYSRVDGEGVMEIRVGPIHAGIIEPGHFRFSAVGEMVVNLEVRLFYVHRALETRAVGMAPPAALVLAERVSGTSAVGHSLAAARAIEAALGVEVPPAHAAVRLLLLELERFTNHVADLGNLCAGTALAGLLAEGLLLKERLWRMAAKLTGSRLLRGLIGVGGLRRRPSAAELEEAVAGVRGTLADLESFAAKFLGSASNLERLSGTGILSAEHARKLGTVGVVARGSGLATDARLDLARGPVEEEAYQGLAARIETSGDVLARAQVRLHEARDSARLCSALLALVAKAGDAPPGRPAREAGEGFGWAEGPRGEILTYARLEKGRLARLRVRSPSRMNWPAIAHAMPGNIVPDFPLINKSFNLSYAGCDL